MKLHYGHIMRNTHYTPAFYDEPARFLFQLTTEYRVLGLYEASTPEGIIDQLKTNGHEVLGEDVLDYAGSPRTAFEYLLIKEVLTNRGFTDDEIESVLGGKR